MRVINSDQKAMTQYGTKLEEMFLAILMRETQSLLMNPVLDPAKMVKFEKLMNMYYKNLKVDAREEYRIFCLANGVKNVDPNDPFVRKLQELMTETPQITP